MPLLIYIRVVVREGNMRTSQKKILDMVILAMLLALVIVLQAFAGFIKVGPFSPSLVLIPIAREKLSSNVTAKIRLYKKIKLTNTVTEIGAIINNSFTPAKAILPNMGLKRNQKRNKRNRHTDARAFLQKNVRCALGCRI